LENNLRSVEGLNVKVRLKLSRRKQGNNYDFRERKELVNEIFKKCKSGWAAAVILTYNPSSSGGRDQENCNTKPDQVNSL
jgi:hypothetical protein